MAWGASNECQYVGLFKSAVKKRISELFFVDSDSHCPIDVVKTITVEHPSRWGGVGDAEGGVLQNIN